ASVLGTEGHRRLRPITLVGTTAEIHTFKFECGIYSAYWQMALYYFLLLMGPHYINKYECQACCTESLYSLPFAYNPKMDPEIDELPLNQFNQEKWNFIEKRKLGSP
ncbi:hypothetical protein ACJX0J_042412, partial [Zea mays]